MLYALITDDGKTFDISCEMSKLPKTIKALKRGVDQGYIKWDEEFETAKKQERKLAKLEDKTKLNINWSRVRQGRYINWIPVENL